MTGRDSRSSAVGGRVLLAAVGESFGKAESAGPGRPSKCEMCRVMESVKVYGTAPNV